MQLKGSLRDEEWNELVEWNTGNTEGGEKIPTLSTKDAIPKKTRFEHGTAVVMAHAVAELSRWLTM